MKSIFKILVLGVVPILMATAVVDEGLAADKGSQLIFQSNMAHTNFISVVNTSGTQAVTVLTQYYNNEMEMVLWYLRVIAPNTTVLVDPFDHAIPGPDEANAGDEIMASGKMGNGHFVIAITAVGANVMVDHTDDDTDNATANTESTVNVLFPDFLAKGMHMTGNIDECGQLWAIADVAAAPTADPPTSGQDPLVYTKNLVTDKKDCDDTDISSKNVGGLTIANAQPIAFNHLTGHFTEALVGTDTGGGDQTASWGGTPVVRPAVTNRLNAGTRDDYTTLNGMEPLMQAAANWPKRTPVARRSIYTPTILQLLDTIRSATISRKARRQPTRWLSLPQPEKSKIRRATSGDSPAGLWCFLLFTVEELRPSRSCCCCP